MRSAAGLSLVLRGSVLHMRRICCLILALLFSVTVIGCGKDNSEPVKQDTKKGRVPPQEK